MKKNHFKGILLCSSPMPCYCPLYFLMVFVCVLSFAILGHYCLAFLFHLIAFKVLNHGKISSSANNLLKDKYYINDLLIMMTDKS